MGLRVHQLLPSFSRRDAIGQHTIALRSLLRSMDCESEIFAVAAHGPMKKESRPADELRRDADAVIYQLSIGSWAAERWATHPGARLAYYHNVTPWHFVGRWDETLSHEVVTARDQLFEVAGQCDHAIANSDFSRAELTHAGFRSTETLPVLFEANAAKPRRWTLRRLQNQRRGTQVLFVGRLMPHKNQHQLVAAVKVLRDCLGDDAHLHLVGGELPSYRTAVNEAVKAGEMARHVTFHGSVTPEKLAALYEACDVFCCLSDHEGFCVPLIEAMAHGLPVVTHDRGAVSETVGDAALLLGDRHPVVVACAINRVMTDAAFRQQLIDAGTQRAQSFSRSATEERYRASLESLLGAL